MPMRTSRAAASASRTAQLSSEKRRVEVDINLCSGNRADRDGKPRMDIQISGNVRKGTSDNNRRAGRESRRIGTAPSYLIYFLTRCGSARNQKLRSGAGLRCAK